MTIIYNQCCHPLLSASRLITEMLTFIAILSSDENQMKRQIQQFPQELFNKKTEFNNRTHSLHLCSSNSSELTTPHRQGGYAPGLLWTIATLLDLVLDQIRDKCNIKGVFVNVASFSFLSYIHWYQYLSVKHNTMETFLHSSSVVMSRSMQYFQFW